MSNEIVNPCDFEHCPHVATFNVRVPLPGCDSYEIDVCDEHCLVARSAMGATVQEWFDLPRHLAEQKGRAA